MKWDLTPQKAFIFPDQLTVYKWCFPVNTVTPLIDPLNCWKVYIVPDSNITPCIKNIYCKHYLIFEQFGLYKFNISEYTLWLDNYGNMSLLVKSEWVMTYNSNNSYSYKTTINKKTNSPFMRFIFERWEWNTISTKLNNNLKLTI